MKLVSWNVNGLRAVIGKDFYESVKALDPDVLCLQEIKMQKGQCSVDLPGYEQYFNCADKKGYSGTAVFSRVPVQGVTYGIGIDEHDHEGRVITLDMPDFYLVCVYVPNSQDELKRLDYRMKWEDDFRNYVCGLAGRKGVIICGDLNVAHEEIDIKNPSSNRRNAGFTDEEREKMTVLQDAGFIDTFRHFYPDLEQVYSWWSYRFNSRKNNAGWRIDYFLTSRALEGRLKDAEILTDIMGSDHCPVTLIIE